MKDEDELELVKILKSVKCQMLKTGCNAVSQEYFFCNCDPDQKEPICKECMYKCHRELGHSIASFTKLTAVCQCGQKCHKVGKEQVNQLNIYETNCYFYEFMEKAKVDKVYVKPDGSVICGFCVKFCENNTMVKTRKLNDGEVRICQCIAEEHKDIKNIYKDINSLIKFDTLGMPYFSWAHLINLIINCPKLFRNLYSDFEDAINSINREIKKNEFNFDSNIAYSNFAWSLSNFAYLSMGCKNYLYFSRDWSQYLTKDIVFNVIERKIGLNNFNLWTIKYHLLQSYKKLIIGSDFVIYPTFTINDYDNMSPFMRMLCVSSLQEDKHIVETYVDANSKYITQLINLIDRINSSKEFNYVSYEVLRLLYLIIKKLAKFDLLTYENLLKLSVVNDRVLMNLFHFNLKHEDEADFDKIIGYFVTSFSNENAASDD